jgi:methionine-S-sulfoxide reductase
MSKTSHGGLQSAIFAGGCFWCVESDFRKRPDIKDIESGYTGGNTDNPSYETAAGSGHREAVRLWYDPEQTSYKELLAYFFAVHDPTDAGGSFHDRGHTYTSAIYYNTDKQKDLAEDTIKTLDEAGVFDKDIATDILPVDEFWTAEEYHQKYAEKNPGHYGAYRTASGREEFKKGHMQKIFNALGL